MKRKRIIPIVLLIVACGLNNTHAYGGNARFILDVRPASFLLSPDLEGFTLRDAGNTSRETISDGFSWTPSVNAGVCLALNTCEVTLTAGSGYLWNDGFSGSFWQADLGILFDLAEGRLRIGPHVGVLGLSDATWDPLTNDTGKGQVDLAGHTGFKGGLGIQTGSNRMGFIANVDFVDNRYDVSTSNGWVAQDDRGVPVTELDMSGMMIDLGLVFRF